MSTDTYTLRGAWDISPNSTASSGSPSLGVPFEEIHVTDKFYVDEVELLADVPVAVSFGGITNAHIIGITSDRKVRIRLTSSDGTQQSIPVDGFLKLISRTTPITAIDLTRVAGQTTTVRIFLCQRA